MWCCALGVYEAFNGAASCMCGPVFSSQLQSVSILDYDLCGLYILTCSCV